MSNSLDPDDDQCSIGPDLGPNCLQRLSADDNIRQEFRASAYESILEHTYRRINIYMYLYVQQLIPFLIAEKGKVTIKSHSK